MTLRHEFILKNAGTAPLSIDEILTTDLPRAKTVPIRAVVAVVGGLQVLPDRLLWSRPSRCPCRMRG